jgi:hypothetical protein
MGGNCLSRVYWVNLIWIVWLAGIVLMLLNLAYNIVPRRTGF